MASNAWIAWSRAMTSARLSRRKSRFIKPWRRLAESNARSRVSATIRIVAGVRQHE
jgi:hypothetical protein